jgi:hypothetical protein
MRTPTIFAVSILLAVCSAPQALAQAKVDAQVLFTVSQPAPKGLTRSLTFSTEAKPGKGQELRLSVKANRECRAVAVALTRDGKLAYAGLPDKITVDPKSEKIFPPPGTWTWEGKENLAEIDLILAVETSPDYQELSKLLDAMHKPNVKDEAKPLQVASLRKWIDGHSQSKAEYRYGDKPVPVPVGGMLRGGEKAHQDVSIPANGYVIIRLKLN